MRPDLVMENGAALLPSELFWVKLLDDDRAGMKREAEDLEQRRAQGTSSAHPSAIHSLNQGNIGGVAVA